MCLTSYDTTGFDMTEERLGQAFQETKMARIDLIEVRLPVEQKRRRSMSSYSSTKAMESISARRKPCPGDQTKRPAMPRS
jgi:hypothetical protein